MLIVSSWKTVHDLKYLFRFLVCMVHDHLLEIEGRTFVQYTSIQKVFVHNLEILVGIQITTQYLVD